MRAIPHLASTAYNDSGALTMFVGGKSLSSIPSLDTHASQPPLRVDLRYRHRGNR